MCPLVEAPEGVSSTGFYSLFWLRNHMVCAALDIYGIPRDEPESLDGREVFAKAALSDRHGAAENQI